MPEGLTSEAETRLRKASRSTGAVWAAVFALTAITLYATIAIGGRAYYAGSVLIIVYALAPFYVSFESSRPKARELVMIAVMCSICVASRAAFIWVPFVKPIAALVVISGMAFGARSGFIIGSASMLASNFIFGQGPWTPWQMLAFGLIGFLAGILSERGLVQCKNLRPSMIVMIAVGSGLFVLLVAGPILDTCTLFTMVSNISFETAAAVYLAGLPVNAIQAAGTAVTFILIGAPFLDKLTRLKTKYGIS